MTAKQTLPTIAVATYGYAEFDAVVSTLGAGPGLAQLGPAAQYFATVTNNSPKTITSLRMLFEATATNPKPISGVQVLEPISLVAGGSFLVAPSPLNGIASAIRANSRRLPTLLAALPSTNILEGKTITVSVDSVKFSDGTSTGPDALNLVERLAQVGPQVQAFLSELSTLLQSTASDTQIQS